MRSVCYARRRRRNLKLPARSGSARRCSGLRASSRFPTPPIVRSSGNQEGAKQFLADLIDNSKTAYEKSAGCNFPIYQKTLPNLIVRLEEDPRADPPYKYKALKDALHWTRNLGFPGYANPAGMEVFNSFVIPRMFISVATGQSSPEDAVQVAEAEVTRIADRWGLNSR
jgi:multiple sugar transport system substrate-binding protein